MSKHNESLHVDLILILFLLCFSVGQDFNALVRYLNQFSPDEFLSAMSNFHLLVFLATCDMLPLKVMFIFALYSRAKSSVPP